MNIRNNILIAIFNFFSKIVSFLLVVILTHVLSQREYGYYIFALNIITIFIIFTQFGLPNLIIRELSVFLEKNNFRNIISFLKFIKDYYLISVTVSILLLLCLIFLEEDNINSIEPYTVYLGLALIPLIFIKNIFISLYNVYNKLLQATFFNSFILPIFFISFILLGDYLVNLDSRWVMGFYVFSNLIVVLLLIFFFKDKIKLYKFHFTFRFNKYYIHSLVGFGLISAISIIEQKIDSIMIGIILLPKDVALYNVAISGGLFVSFILGVVNMIIGPKISRLFVKNDINKLQKILNYSSLIISSYALVISLIYFLFGEFLLSKFFGNNYIYAYNTLLLVACAQFINAFFGSVGHYLTMSGNEKETLSSLIGAMMLNIILNFILIPIYGINGAAIATIISTLYWNMTMSIKVYKKLNIISTIFGFKRRFDDN